MCFVRLACRDDQYKCENTSRCIPAYKICDGYNDCGDQSDKRDCSKWYFTTYFTGFRNFSVFFWCSVFPNCSPLPMCFVRLACPDDYFQCENTGRCLPAFVICDGYNECGDFSDERNCSKWYFAIYFTVFHTFVCSQGLVLPSCYSRLMCSVRLECPDDYFQCERKGRCIPPTWICNGYNECGDYSDERNCSK